MLAKLGIQVDRKYIQALLRAIDVNGNGLIEFEEFATLVIYDPYKWVNEYFSWNYCLKRLRNNLSFKP